MPATHSPALPFRSWRGPEPAQLGIAQPEQAQPQKAQRRLATSRQPPVPARTVLPRMLLLRMVLPRMVPQRLRPKRPPDVNAIPRDLHGRDDGERFAVSVPRPRMEPRRTLARPQAPPTSALLPCPHELWR